MKRYVLQFVYIRCASNISFAASVYLSVLVIWWLQLVVMQAAILFLLLSLKCFASSIEVMNLTKSIKSGSSFLCRCYPVGGCQSTDKGQ